MHKEEVLFQPWAVRYHHNHPDKTVGKAKVITVAKNSAGHTSLAPVPQPRKMPNVLRQLSGNMDQQSVLVSSCSQ